MTFVAIPLPHSSPIFSASSSRLTSSSSFSPSFDKSVLVLLHSDSRGHATVSKALKLKLGSINCFKEDHSGEHEIQMPKESALLPSTVGNGLKKNQEALLKRIAYEVKRKKEHDRESTPLVRALTWTCREAKEAADVHAIVGDVDLKLPIFTSALQKLGIERNPQAAVAVFQWLQSTSDRRPNVFTYNSLLGALKANGWYEKAESVFLTMEHDGVFPDIVTYNTLISLYEHQGRFDEALKIFHSLPLARGVQPTLFTFRNIIQILTKTGDVDTALDVFGEFRQQMRRINDEKTVPLKRDSEQRRQLEATMTQFCCKRFISILHSPQEKDKECEALQFLNRLKRAQVELDAHAYERLILGCGSRERDHKIVKLLYGNMKHLQVQMSVSLCNHVIKVLGQGKKWWAALEVFEQMVELGPEPDASSYKLIQANFQILLNAARRRKIWKWSLQLIDKMIDKGVEPDEFSWNAALISCSRAGETAAAVFVFQKMIERGQKPGILSYGALLSALEKSNSLSEAELVWEHMRNLGLKPNIVAYTTMVALYGKVGKYSEALRLVEQMRDAGIQPSVVTFNALITACAKTGDGERALDLVEQMKAARIQPDAITYAQLIEALANEGRWEAATAAFAKMQELHFEPPPYAYDAVVRVCKANNIDFDLHLQPEHSGNS